MSALLIAIPLGYAGAAAFNPDGGVVLRSEVLWRIFGIMCEGSVLLMLAVVMAAALVAGIGWASALRRSSHA